MSFLKEKPRIIPMVMRGCCYPNYTIPRNNRELQPCFPSMELQSDYTTILALFTKTFPRFYKHLIATKNMNLLH